VLALIPTVLDGLGDRGHQPETHSGAPRLDVCTECDMTVWDMTVAGRDSHLIREGAVFVGCEGYYTPVFVAAWRHFNAAKYPRINDTVRVHHDYGPDELCLGCGGQLGENAVAVEHDDNYAEFICEDCRPGVAADITAKHAMRQPSHVRLPGRFLPAIRAALSPHGYGGPFEGPSMYGRDVLGT
jgi:hypothetical protein